MKIRIVVDDRLVSVDGCVIKMPDLDWQHVCFWGLPEKKWDDVAAVQFDVARGMGHIEMITVETDDPDQPNFRASDRPLNQEKFDKLFGWVLPLHAARKVEIEAERARLEAEAAAAQQAALENPLPEKQNNASTVDLSHIESSMAAKDAVIAQMQAKLAALEGKVGVFEDAVKEVSGGGI